MIEDNKSTDELATDKKSFDLASALSKAKKPSDETIIGAGKTVDDLKIESDKAMVTSGNPTNQSNRNSDPNQSSSKIEKVINVIDHASALIKLLSPFFADSRAKVKAHNQLKSYFNTDK